MAQHCLIIGASHAAAQLVVSLRQSGWAGDITVAGDEAELPYHHPPLSKDVLSGEKDISDILIRPKEAYEQANVTMMLGERAAQIDRVKRAVSLASGTSLRYDKLVLATGARVRKLPIEGAGHSKVFYLRDMADIGAIKLAMEPGKKAVIIGGGYIGLETAASLTKCGIHVTILEAMPRILQRVTAPKLSAFYKRVHQEEGVIVEENITASRIDARGDGLVVMGGDGRAFPADFVIVGIGVIPNVELAEGCGLDVGNGIKVNEFCQTSDPNIYAAGDVTWHHNPIYDCHLRLESVPNATEQAKIVASHICGNPKVYNSLPWFWSDQFDLKLQIAGLSTGYDDLVLRGDPDDGRSFAAFYFKGDKLLAVDAVNSPREFAMTRMLLTKGKGLDKKKITDVELALKEAVI